MGERAVGRVERPVIANRSDPKARRAKLFEDSDNPGVWRVEKRNAEGGYDDLQVFIGPDAREKATRYAIRTHGQYDIDGR
jgi:hypothetical protein